jgi:hypothetical protein
LSVAGTVCGTVCDISKYVANNDGIQCLWETGIPIVHPKKEARGGLGALDMSKWAARTLLLYPLASLWDCEL